MDNEDFDLYADLDEALIEPLQEEVQKKQAEELEKQKIDEKFRIETEKTISELKTSNFQLKKNMSLLLATAKSEIERKDQQIKDLRREMDEIIFRKNKGTNKKTCDKWSQTDKVEFSENNKNRYSESSKLRDSHKPKVPADFDRHKRKLSPEKRYSDDYRKTSHRDDNSSRSKTYDEKNRKSSHEINRSKSPEKHAKKAAKHELREDDLRKTLLKYKNDDKIGSSSKESSRKSDDKRDSSSVRDKKDKYRNKSEKTDENRNKKKSDHNDSKKEKVVKASPKKDSIEIKEEAIEITKDDPKIERKFEEKIACPEKEIDIDEKLASPKTNKQEVVEPKTNETAEVSNSSNTNETDVEQTAREDTKFKNIEVMSSKLNLSDKSDTNEAPVQSEKVVDKNVEEEKIVMPEKLPEILLNDLKPKETVSAVKIEEPAHKKPKYVPIFEAKIYPDSKDIKYHEAESESVSTPSHKNEVSKKAQKFHPIDTITCEELPITVTIEKTQTPVKDNTIIVETIKFPITEVMQELKEEAVNIPNPQHENNPSTESPNDSFESTKENSLNNSFEKKKHKKRKITTEVEEDGTVVWTVTRKKRKTKEHN